ncbi:hypothetical protein MPOCJGCO_3404 [Methylobacterium trifolii]|uniref:Metallo-beta-lactamase domain-containing protein n=2 Tax=Methylobacterium trifolii TaxID=1003092 RepID=A0ABQ4U4L1_9HYPH|nr:hypothetical protein MPOCJGCO_3404 [Methylobacterium trifolii]
MQMLVDQSSLRPPPKIAPPYNFNIGAADIIVVSDGVLDIGPPAIAFGGSPVEELDLRLKQNFLPTKSITIPMNIPVISINGRNVIFETGIGSSKIFGNSGGLLQNGLIAAGIHPGSIDAVVCSHPHPDHIGGLCDDKGNPRFPNAAIYLTKIDYEYWTNKLHFESSIGFAVRIVRNNLLPLRNRITFFKDNEEFCREYRPFLRQAIPQDIAAFGFTQVMGSCISLVT